MSDSETPWTVACQAPLSMGFPWQDTRVSFHLLLQGILVQGSNPHLLHWQAVSYHCATWEALNTYFKVLIRF